MPRLELHLGLERGGQSINCRPLGFGRCHELWIHLLARTRHFAEADTRRLSTAPRFQKLIVSVDSIASDELVSAGSPKRAQRRFEVARLDNAGTDEGRVIVRNLGIEEAAKHAREDPTLKLQGRQWSRTVFDGGQA